MPATAVAKIEVKELAAPRGYAALLSRVRRILERGRARAKAALEKEQIQTWWEIGREINEDLQKNNGRAKYGERVTFLIARDLEVTPQYIYDISRFQRVFPILKSTLKLTLSHYILLAKIQNSKERNLLLKQTIQANLPVSDLRRAIRSRKLLLLEGRDPEGVRPLLVKKRLTPLKPRRGKPYTYRLVESPNVLTGLPQLEVDFGFRGHAHFDLKTLRLAKANDIVEAVRTKTAAGEERYRFKKSKEGKSALYSFAARVLSLHDADTYWLKIDQGFHRTTEIKIRLRGVDAPELDTSEGGEALAYVRKVLGAVPFAAVTTYWDEKFGRTLIDLFYLPAAKEGEPASSDPARVLAEGRYLNQELLDLGLARRVED